MVQSLNKRKSPGKREGIVNKMMNRLPDEAPPFDNTLRST